MTYWQQPYPDTPPPGPPPAPAGKPKRFVWPWILGLVVLIVLTLPLTLGYGSYLLGQWRDSREVTVTMEVTGAAPTGHVEVNRGDHSESETIRDVSFPWRTTFTVKGTDKHVEVYGWPDSKLNTLSCSITANGRLIAEDRIGGPTTWCSGDANGDSSQIETTTPTSTPTPPPTGPPPESDVWPGLTMPRGSTARHLPNDPDRESWEVPMPFADTVKYLRGQLPINAPYDGRPYCWEINEGDLIIWSWGTQANDVYNVSVQPGGSTTGTDVAISRQARAQECQ